MFNPANWRIHPKAQQDALEGVLSEVGWVQDVIVNKRTGNLIDGHLRCQVAARNEEQTIPVVYVDLSEDEEAIILASLDPLAAMAATDKAKLEELLHQVHSDDARVQQMMAVVADKEQLGFTKSGDDMPGENGFTYKTQFGVIVVCKDEAEQRRVYELLQGDGYECKVVVT
jgi:hypothetical protein